MKTRYYLAGLMMVVLGFVAGGCEFLSQGSGNDGKEAQTIVLTKSQQVVLDKGNDFGFKLLRETFVENGGGNVFLSPMGVTIVSSMLANGAVGETYDEIVAAIGMKGYSLDEINSCYSTMGEGIAGERDLQLLFHHGVRYFEGGPQRGFVAGQFHLGGEGSGTAQAVQQQHEQGF